MGCSSAEATVLLYLRIASLLFVLCFLPAVSFEETTDRCISDVVCASQELRSSPRSMLQGKVAKSGVDVAKEDVLAMTGGALSLSAENAFRTGPTLLDELGALWSVLEASGLVFAVHILVFIVASAWFPMVYAHNVIAGKAPAVSDCTELKGWKWVVAAWSLTPVDASKYIGLDCTMLIEFIDMSIKILAMIGLPMAFVVGPLNNKYGDAGLNGALNKVDEQNLQIDNIMYFRDALIVWYVVFVVNFWAGRSHQKFGLLRRAQLRDMPPPQCRTIMVQNLAQGLCSDTALKRTMVELFDENAVESAFVVRSEDGSPNKDMYATSGFVTFRKRRDLEVALNLRLAGPEADQNEISEPPAPADVMYDVLQQDAGLSAKRAKGLALIASLFILYLPLTMFIALVSSLSTMEAWIPPFATFTKAHPRFASAWTGIVGPALLTVLPGFVPTILMQIIQGYFALPATSWCQSMLERWYFIFQMTFALFLFSFTMGVRHELISAWSAFVDYQAVLLQPWRILDSLIPNLQKSSTFYLFLIPLDICTHTSALCRIVNLLKFLWYRRSNDDEKAHDLAEPEDQDYQGVGCRSARVMQTLVITIVYCTMTSFIGILALLDFMVCRVVYTYLMVFAEGRKQDSGGWIWVSMLKQIQFGLFTYVTLMTSIIYQRSSGFNHAPAYIAACAYLEIIRFSLQDHELHRLSIEEVVALDKNDKDVEPSGSYAQPAPEKGNTAPDDSSK